MAFTPGNRGDLLVIKSKDPATAKSFKLVFDDQGAQQFLPPEHCEFIGGTYTLTRNAQGDVSMNKTAAADTTFILIPLRPLLKTVIQTSTMYNDKKAADRGCSINSVDIVYSIGTAALTSQTPTLNQIVYANNIANAVNQTGLAFTGALAIATQVNPYVSTLTLTVPYLDMTADSDVNLELAVVAALTSVFKFYGAFVNYSQNSF